MSQSTLCVKLSITAPTQQVVTDEGENIYFYQQELKVLLKWKANINGCRGALNN